MTPLKRFPGDNPFLLMGVVNVTPDSFFDGGRYSDPARAVEQGLRLRDEGAAIIDVGGESTRPGAALVSSDEELRRIMPVIEALAAKGVVVSVDTSKSVVAAEALKSGASWINDISAGRFDPLMAGIAARHNCPVVLMHSRHTPQTMQENPHYENVVTEVCAELQAAASNWLKSGVAPENIIVDPGIGFGKRLQDNVMLLRHIDNIVKLGYPVLVGTSNKSFIGALTGRSPDDRGAGTLGSVAAAWCRGIRMFRVHDVASAKDLLTVLSAIGPIP